MAPVDDVKLEHWLEVKPYLTSSNQLQSRIGEVLRVVTETQESLC